MRDPVIVMGMMRSGTTLLAEMIHKGGTPMFEVADQVNPAYDGGIKYERPSTHEINLALLGQTQNIAGINVVGLKLHPLPPGALQDLSKEVGDQAWGFKDPRTTVTYPIWCEAFPRGPRLYTYRGHQEVMRFYFRSRQEMRLRLQQARRALKAWVHFNEQILCHIASDQSAGRPVALVRYEALMENKELIGAIEKAVNVPLFDARNFDLHRNKLPSNQEKAIFRGLSLGYQKRIAALYRELDALALK
ncbi:Sulfotransferase family protein [Abditibacterium utsteinense]|uniref:Sulfotransferase family protein n=1 Tax=Abditibacterium utsteinense TaxID=1960156 RepID=A0A2S8SXN0_9BACT|nr:sulfotransferase [Abditibacterium utsteinense]PQV65557.1 Sulfotransferase family protein [Abditibacterium utsteinense]